MHGIGLWWRRWKYQRAVDANIRRLLFPLTAREIKDLHSLGEFHAATAAAFEQRLDVYRVSVHQAAILLSLVFDRNGTKEDRDRLLDILSGDAQPEATKNVRESFVSFWHLVISNMDRCLRSWVKAGRISDAEQEFLLTEVVGALAGLSSNERMLQRIRQTFGGILRQDE